MQEESVRAMEAQGVARDLRKIDNRRPNLVNLNEDPQLSEMLIYILKEGFTSTLIGSMAHIAQARQSLAARTRLMCNWAVPSFRTSMPS